jgi:hypothetical protein
MKICFPYCCRFRCQGKAQTLVEQCYPDGSRTQLWLCKTCAEKWLAGRPETSRMIKETL